MDRPSSNSRLETKQYFESTMRNYKIHRRSKSLQGSKGKILSRWYLVRETQSAADNHLQRETRAEIYVKPATQFKACQSGRTEVDILAKNSHAFMLNLPPKRAYTSKNYANSHMVNIFQ